MILLAIGVLTIGTMIWCILRESYNKPKSPQQISHSNRDDMIIDDQSESNYETIADGDDESVYDSN